ncbi:MAG: sigma-54 dependent transcriptional regulator [Myxococcota bacterium]|nr:sigma-54 dependent transcriptional regulator [Myxococcota bacterium]
MSAELVMGNLTPQPVVLLVDDNQRRRENLSSVLINRDLKVLEAASGVQARSQIQNQTPAAVIVELDMKDDDALFVMQIAQSFDSPPKIIAKSELGSVSQAVQAMQNGASTVLQSPLNVDALIEQLQFYKTGANGVTRDNWLDEQETSSPSQIEKNNRLMRGNSNVLERVYRMISRVAPTSTNVLITGESGVGKELIAQEIHGASLRSEGPLVTVNCAAIPDSLLESELFGHKKGAFTNATSDREGRFRQASGGTIFLDEIGEMKLDLQAKLLRVLQEREFQPVGSNETIKGDFRVVAATNQELETHVEKGLFRKDLYYRLSVFPIQVAPLRERKEDILELVNHFILEFNEDRFTEISGLSTNVMTSLQRYDWPGNIRELRNVVERMVILRGEGEIEEEDLPERFVSQVELSPLASNQPTHANQASRDQFSFPPEGLNLKAALVDYEKSLIMQALTHTNGNKNQAAQLLSINRTTLVEKIKRLKIAL